MLRENAVALMLMLLAAGLGLSGLVPGWLWVAYALQWAETVRGVTRPAVGLKPRAIGLRLLLVSTGFTLLFVLGWLRG